MYSRDNDKNRYVFLIAIILVAYLIIAHLEQFFASFLGALMFYILSKPFNCWLVQKKGWSKSISASLIILISFVFIMLPLILIFGLMYQRISTVLGNPNFIDNTLKNINNIIVSKYHFSIISDKAIASIKEGTSKFLPLFLNKSISAVSTIIMLCFFLYFMIINTGKMEAGIMLYLPFRRSDIKLFGDELAQQTISNSVSVPLISLAQGIAAFIAYKITGLPEAGFWAIITGIVAIIPIVGTALVWAPVAAYMLLLNEEWKGIFIIVYGLLVLSTLDNVVRFILAKKVANVHPVITVLGVIVGVQFFGVLGLIFGPLIISYLLTAMKIYYVQYRKPLAEKRNVIKENVVT